MFLRSHSNFDLPPIDNVHFFNWIHRFTNIFHHILGHSYGTRIDDVHWLTPTPKRPLEWPLKHFGDLLATQNLISFGHIYIKSSLKFENLEACAKFEVNCSKLCINLRQMHMWTIVATNTLFTNLPHASNFHDFFMISMQSVLEWTTFYVFKVARLIWRQWSSLVHLPLP